MRCPPEFRRRNQLSPAVFSPTSEIRNCRGDFLVIGNWIFPGRDRLPFTRDCAHAFSFSSRNILHLVVAYARQPASSLLLSVSVEEEKNVGCFALILKTPPPLCFNNVRVEGLSLFLFLSFTCTFSGASQRRAILRWIAVLSRAFIFIYFGVTLFTIYARSIVRPIDCQASAESRISRVVRSLKYSICRLREARG